MLRRIVLTVTVPDGLADSDLAGLVEPLVRDALERAGASLDAHAVTGPGRPAVCDADYTRLRDCREHKLHLTSVDRDGCCNYCGCW